MATIARPHPAPASVRLAAPPLLFALILLGIHRTEARISSAANFFYLPPSWPASPPPPPPPPQRKPPSFPSSPYMDTHSSNPSISGIIGGCVVFFSSISLGVFAMWCRSHDEGEDNNVERRNDGRGVDLEVLVASTMTYAKAKELDGGNGALECAVCLAEFSDDDALRLAPICRHVFHVKCIDTWLESHVTCPVCRSNLSVQPESTAAATSTENTAASRNSEEMNGAGFPIRPVAIRRWNSTGHEAVESYSTLRQPDGAAQLDIRATPTQEQKSSLEDGGRNGQGGGARRWRTLLRNLSLDRASRKQEDHEASSSSSFPRGRV